jgi:gliding motility-associated lipoprotein GldH
VEQTVFPQKQVYRDTIDCHIINKEGRLEGKNGISSTEVVAHLRTLQLQQGDSLTISIRHDMRRELLPGISDVGVKITGE